MTELQQKVQALLRKRPGLTVREIYYLLEYSHSTLCNRMPRMREAGAIHISGWTQTSGRVWTPQYAAGPGYNVPRPLLQPKRVEINRRYRRKVRNRPVVKNRVITSGPWAGLA